MKLPNKITSYKESIISKMPLLLKKLNTKNFSVIDLYIEIHDKISIKDYYDTVVALYVLGKIKIIEGVIYYVERTIL